MTERQALRLGWPMAITLGISLLAIGAVLAVLMTRPLVGEQVDRTSTEPAGSPRMSTTPGVDARGPATVSLTAELIRRAQIEVAEVETASVDANLRLPGEVQPNAYRSVSVTPLVAGRITTVESELGDQVAAAAVMARVYSPELARAQTTFLASRAELMAHDQRLRRTERLLEIGAASQQELEEVHAEHTAMTTRVEADRSTLELLGLSAARIAQLTESAEVSALVDVPAPISGVVTERRANVGLNVDPSMSLFTVVDLSTVWVVADLYERDFAAVGIGNRATITAAAYPDFRFEGRVSYIDPQIRNDTRTTRLRVEVPDRAHRLRLGMYVDVLLHGRPGDPVVVIPVDAAQPIGDRYVVYVLAETEGTFVEREVALGQQSGELVHVESGLSAGDRVVVKGAFFLRAERERVAR